MRLDVALEFHAGVQSNPRPSLRITARAQRRGRGGLVEEFVHSRLVDHPYPETWAEGLEKGLEKLQQLRHKRDPFFFDALGMDPIRKAEIMVG